MKLNVFVTNENEEKAKCTCNQFAKNVLTIKVFNTLEIAKL